MTQVLRKQRVVGEAAKKGTSTGSTLGKILGLGAGLAATVASGGAAAPALIGSASAGMGLGGAVGGMFDKPGQASTERIEQEQSTQAAGSIQRRRDALDQVEQLKKAQAAVMQLPPAQQESFAAPINEALARAQKSIQQGSAV
jgi:hypothetical protein